MMKKKVIIAGAGMGNPAGMTSELLLALEKAELIIGPARLVRPFQEEGRKVFCEYRADRILSAVEKAEENRILILVSGDQGFFSAAERIGRLLSSFHPQVLPGISSVAYFSAKIGVPYSSACIRSAHGRSLNIASVVRRNRVSFILAGGNLQELLKTLCRFGYPDVEVYTGEELSYETEKIRCGTAMELAGGGGNCLSAGRDWTDDVNPSGSGQEKDSFSSLSLMAVINPEAEEAVPFGIPDGEFIRGTVPMTKREARSLILSSLKLRADSVVVDIGAGTGSVSVEAALSAYKGTVYAVERKKEALELIHSNAIRFHTDNLRIIEGEAPEALHGLPPAEAYFIGGTGGRMGEILDYLKEKVCKCTCGQGSDCPESFPDPDRSPEMTSENGCRVVISASTLQTLTETQQLLHEKQFRNISFTQIQASRSQKVGRYDFMKAENPVFVITAEMERSQTHHG